MIPTDIELLRSGFGESLDPDAHSWTTVHGRLAAAVAAERAGRSAAVAGRPPVRRWLVPGLAAATAVLLLVLVVGSPGTVGDRTPPSSPALPTVAYVTARSACAMVTADDEGILFEKEYRLDAGATATVVAEIWTDASTGQALMQTYDGSGQVTGVLQQSVSGQIEVLDYPARAWWTESVLSTTPDGATERPIIAPALGTPEQIAALLAHGAIRLVGRAHVDGQDTIELTGPGPLPGSRFTMWVNASTFVPVRSIGASDIAHGGTPPGAQWESDYTWLPATAANRADLSATIPAGFTHRAGPPPASSPPGPGLG